MLGYLRVSLFATFLLCMSGCGRTWNPDEQFQNQVDQISFQREMSRRQNLVEAHKNISQFEMTLERSWFQALPKTNSWTYWVILMTCWQELWVRNFCGNADPMILTL